MSEWVSGWVIGWVGEWADESVSESMEGGRREEGPGMQEWRRPGLRESKPASMSE